MGKKGRSISAWLLTLGFAFAASSIGSAQVKASKKASPGVRSAAPGSVEPLRVINGQMRGRNISGQFMLNRLPSDFSLVLTKAEIVGEKLLLTGDFRLGPRTSALPNVRARIAGTMAKAADPWPGPSNNAPKANPAEDQAECEVLFLSLDLTQRLRVAMGAGARPVQLGVVLAPLDNHLGEKINSNICAIVGISGNGSRDGRLLARVDDLNRLLTSSR
jgi:hypothetical protein